MAKEVVAKISSELGGPQNFQKYWEFKKSYFEGRGK